METFEGVYEIVPMQECTRCRQEIVGADLGGHRQVCGSRPQENSIKIVRQGIQDEEARQDSKSFSFAVVLGNATTRSSESVGLNYDVCEVVEQRETFEVETLRHKQGTLSRNSAETQKHPYSSRIWSEIWWTQSWHTHQEHVWNSICFSHLGTRLRDPDLWRVASRREESSVVEPCV